MPGGAAAASGGVKRGHAAAKVGHSPSKDGAALVEKLKQHEAQNKLGRSKSRTATDGAGLSLSQTELELFRMQLVAEIRQAFVDVLQPRAGTGETQSQPGLPSPAAAMFSLPQPLSRFPSAPPPPSLSLSHCVPSNMLDMPGSQPGLVADPCPEVEILDQGRPDGKCSRDSERHSSEKSSEGAAMGRHPSTSEGRKSNSDGLRPSDSGAMLSKGKAENLADHGLELGHGMLDVEAAYLLHLDEEVYNVEDFYKREGTAQMVARTERFKNLTLAVIALNAVYLGIDADRNEADVLTEANWYFQLCEHLFCFVFTVEIVIRFVAFDNKWNCFRDGWFKFDSVLVTLMVFETWVMSLVYIFTGGSLVGLPTAPLRLLRLLRLSRLVRLMRSMPELVTMVKGMRVACRAVGSSLIMVCLLVYVFGIILLMVCAGNVESEPRLHGNFGTLGFCMWTLLMDGTFMDSTGTVLLALRNMNNFDGYMAIICLMVFILLSAMTVMNMLIGVLCEVVSAVAQQERDEAEIRLVKESVLKELLSHDNGDGMITKEELSEVLHSERSMAVLASLEVDLESISEVQAMLFRSQDEVPIKAIMETLIAYRGNQPATVKHVVDTHCFSRNILVEELQTGMEELKANVLSCTRLLLNGHGGDNMQLTELASPAGFDNLRHGATSAGFMPPPPPGCIA